MPYQLDFRLVDAQTGVPISNLRLQAWDRDMRVHDMLGERLNEIYIFFLKYETYIR